MNNAVFSTRFQGGRLELGGKSLFGVSPRGGTSAWELQLPYASLGNLQGVVVAATGASVGSRTKGVGLEVRTTVGSSYPVAEIGLLDGTGSLLTIPASYLSDLTTMLTALAAAWPSLSEDDLDGSSRTMTEPLGLSEETLAALRSEQSATFAAANPTLAVTYNGDGSVSSTTENGVVTTFTYNGDGTVNTQTRAGVTKTFSYGAFGVTGAI